MDTCFLTGASALVSLVSRLNRLGMNRHMFTIAILSFLFLIIIGVVFFVFLKDDISDVIQTGAGQRKAMFPDAVFAAQAELARYFGIHAQEVVILEVGEVQWPDACLGLPREGEVCAQVITPGYYVRMKLGDKEYLSRTSRDGSVIRFDPS